MDLDPAPAPAQAPVPPAVVFVHGMRTSSAIWREQLTHVHRLGHDATAVDLPAHGALHGERFTMPRAFEVIDDAVAAFGPDRPVAVVGLSLGGYTTLAWAARRTPHTSRLAGVIAVGCTSDPKGKPVALYRDLAQGFVNTVGGARTAMSRMSDILRATSPLGRSAQLVAPAPGGADLRKVAVAPGQSAEIHRPGWRVVTDALTHLAGRSSLADLRRVDAPVWLVNGARDAMRLEERRHLRAAQDAALVVVPGAGHDVNTDDPTSFNQVLTRALAAFSAPRTV
ncbi:alpha/beta fold hydrolase [Myceligenerans indicum]|uniref:Alpha/beta hydrolase n=1 Tax=Myceligenerans indicum TaxID=2593663 RepID=A0ABS1LFF4_9MICO|nr:alpha/beta hydrolase [Myceligenerans indicum]MBL0884799.1 alpha/beta hydrolase [Myceligenerans indicum]